MESIVDIRDVFLGYDRNSIILENINVKINKGQFFVIKGKNGIGKTTFIRFLYMKLLPIKGEYYIFNNKVETKDRTYIQKTRKRIGVIQQNSYLIPYLSVFQNIQISLEIQSKDKYNFNDKILQILKWVGIERKINEKIQTLSSGERQKVILARAVVSNPELIIADEPVLNLDDQTKKKIFFLLRSLTRLGTTVILSGSNIDFEEENNSILNLDEHSRA